MHICTNCKKEMTCTRTGVLVLYGHTHGYMGDEFGCQNCGTRVISLNALSFAANYAVIDAKEADNRLLRMGEIGNG